MFTRTGGPPLPPQAASAISAPAVRPRATRLARRSADTLQRMLKKNGGGERVDVAFSSVRRTAHLANRAERRGRRVALVDQLDRQSGALAERVGDAARFGRARCLVAISVEGQSHH